jgi:hypothetical protein
MSQNKVMETSARSIERVKEGVIEGAFNHNFKNIYYHNKSTYHKLRETKNNLNT